MCDMPDITFRKKTLQDLSIDTSGPRTCVTDSTVKAIDFDNFATERCKNWNIQKLRSCDALLINQTTKYLIEFKNRPLHDQNQPEHTPETDEQLLRTADGRQTFDRHFNVQHDLELELLEKLYESLIIMNGAEDEIGSRLVEDHDTLIAIIAVSSQKNNDIRYYNDQEHPSFYSLAFGHGDLLYDGLVMNNLNRSVAVDGVSQNPEYNVDIYNDWFCPRHLKRLEGTLFKKVLFMTGTQLKQFLKLEGFQETK